MSARDWHDAHLINAVIDAHRDDPAFDYRFGADELERAGNRRAVPGGAAAIVQGEFIDHAAAGGELRAFIKTHGNLSNKWESFSTGLTERIGIGHWPQIEQGLYLEYLLRQ